MELVEPSKKYEVSWRQAIEEFRHDDKTIKLWETSGDPNDLEGYICTAQKHAQGIDLPAGWVPYSIYWLVDGEKFIGIVSLRHELNDYLEHEGGHIGYEIRPSERGKGQGNIILGLALGKAKEKNLKKALIACDDKNVAAWSVAEKNGGKLENIVETKTDFTRRYWIYL
jgi:predicted acetyltransferase